MHSISEVFFPSERKSPFEIPRSPPSPRTLLPVRVLSSLLIHSLFHPHPLVFTQFARSQILSQTRARTCTRLTPPTTTLYSHLYPCALHPAPRWQAVYSTSCPSLLAKLSISNSKTHSYCPTFFAISLSSQVSARPENIPLLGPTFPISFYSCLPHLFPPFLAVFLAPLLHSFLPSSPLPSVPSSHS